MDVKAFLTRTSHVSGLYGDDLEIVKPDCLSHESLLHGRHRSESRDQYGEPTWRSPRSGH
jgi:hypothetical protein